MSSPVVINTLEEMQPFLNEKGIMEVAIRDQSKRFETIQKVMINGLSNGQEQKLTQKAIEVINQRTMLSNRVITGLSNIAKLQGFGIILNGLNLCATCAGFKIVSDRMSEMSSTISSQINQLQKEFRQIQDIDNDSELGKVLSAHETMLDRQKRQQPYSLAEQEVLVGNEFNMLNRLINVFRKGITDNPGELIVSIFAALSMFTVSLQHFDALYYFETHSRIKGNDVWHTSHEKWMKAYDTLLSPWFAEKLQDYSFLGTGLSTMDVDTYYISLLNIVADYRDAIIRNQELIVGIDDSEMFRRYKELSKKEIIDSIEDAYKKAGNGIDKTILESECRQMLQGLALA